MSWKCFLLTTENILMRERNTSSLSLFKKKRRSSFESLSKISMKNRLRFRTRSRFFSWAICFVFFLVASCAAFFVSTSTMRRSIWLEKKVVSKKIDAMKEFSVDWDWLSRIWEVDDDDIRRVAIARYVIFLILVKARREDIADVNELREDDEKKSSKCKLMRNLTIEKILRMQKRPVFYFHSSSPKCLLKTLRRFSESRVSLRIIARS